MLMRPPGVYRPQTDTSLLVEVLRQSLPPRARVLELGTGTGAVALAAARAGAAEVTAVDISGRAVLTARLNALVRRLPVRVRRGDLFGPVAGELFDVIVTNPPYVIGCDPAAVQGGARAWEAGPDGRVLLDRICAEAPAHLAPGGTLLIVQSALCGVSATLDALNGAGLRAAVVANRREPFGPVMRERVAELEALGVVRPGQRHEELVVVRADRAAERGSRADAAQQRAA